MTVTMPVLSVGTRVWVAWANRMGNHDALGSVAANWPCGVCFYEADQSQTASIEQIEEAGSRCSRPGIYRVRTDDGRDVMIHPRDARILCVPVQEQHEHRRALTGALDGWDWHDDYTEARRNRERQRHLRAIRPAA